MTKSLSKRQIEKFREAAREHEADQAEAEFDEALKKVAKHKSVPERMAKSPKDTSRR